MTRGTQSLPACASGGLYTFNVYRFVYSFVYVWTCASVRPGCNGASSDLFPIRMRERDAHVDMVNGDNVCAP